MVGMRMRDDRERDLACAVDLERARDGTPGRRRGLEIATAREPAPVDDPDRAVGQLEDRGVPLADVEERHAQRAAGWWNSGLGPRRAERDPQEGVESRALRPHREDQGEHDQHRHHEHRRDGDRADGHLDREHAGERVDPPDEPRGDSHEHAAELRRDRTHDEPERAERQRDELDDGRQHEVPDDATSSNLMKMKRGDGRRRDRDPERRRRTTPEPVRDLAATRGCRRELRAECERERGDERQLERRIDEIVGAQCEHDDRRDAERVDEPHRSIDHLRDQHDRDHEQRTQRRDLRAGDERVRDREHERGRCGPSRRTDPAAPRRRREQPAQQGEREPRDDREMQTADGEHVIDADGTPALIERIGHVAAITGHDAAQRGAARIFMIRDRRVELRDPRRLRLGGPAPDPRADPAGVTEVLDPARRQLPVGTCR